MYKILLVCSAGMSTSLLVNKMLKAAKEQAIDAKVWAVGQGELDANAADADCILMGPQVRFLEDKVRAAANGKPFAVIPMSDYGMMNGKKVLQDAIAMMNNL